MQALAETVRPLGRKKPLSHQKRDDPRPEQFLQGLKSALGMT
jgi:hypothetical protein